MEETRELLQNALERLEEPTLEKYREVLTHLSRPLSLEAGHASLCIELVERIVSRGWAFHLTAEDEQMNAVLQNLLLRRPFVSNCVQELLRAKRWDFKFSLAASLIAYELWYGGTEQAELARDLCKALMNRGWSTVGLECRMRACDATRYQAFVDECKLHQVPISGYY